MDDKPWPRERVLIAGGTRMVCDLAIRRESPVRCRSLLRIAARILPRQGSGNRGTDRAHDLAARLWPVAAAIHHPCVSSGNGLWPPLTAPLHPLRSATKGQAQARPDPDAGHLL